MPALLVAAFVGYWFYLESALRGFVVDWVEDRRAEGAQVTHGTITTGGFPFAVWADIPGPAITVQAGAEMAAWQGETLRISFPPWDFLTYDFDSPGQHLIAIVGDDSIGQWSVEADQVHGSWGIRSGGGAALQLALDSVTVDDMLGQSYSLGSLTARIDIAGEDAPPTEPRLRANGELAMLAVPAALTGPFPPLIEHVRSEVELQASVLPPSLPLLLLVLRDYDGRLLFRDTEIAWGELGLRAEGELWVDQANYLTGRIPLQVTGHQETIEALLDAGLIDAVEAGGISLVAGSMAESGSDGRPTLDLELELIDGAVKVKGVTVMQMGAMPIAGAQS